MTSKPICPECNKKTVIHYLRKDSLIPIGYWCQNCDKPVEEVVRKEPVVHKMLIQDYLQNSSERFDVLLADPPWTYDIEAPRDSDRIGNHYAQLTTEEICRLPVQNIAASRAVFFLWTSSPKLDEAHEVMKSWGFKYSTSIVWDKERIGLGHNVRNQHETILMGKKNGYPTPKFKPPSVFKEKRTEHSRKPEKSYEIIESMYPKATRIELFARFVHPGWTGVGNETIPYAKNVYKVDKKTSTKSKKKRTQKLEVEVI